MEQSQVKPLLEQVRRNIVEACSKRTADFSGQPRLVAVSKTKPKQLIIEAYQLGQRHFGENYIQELIEKSTDPEIQEKCRDINWHMIGHVQGNKINKLINVPNLFLIETIDSQKLAENINRAINNSPIAGQRVKIFIQINTSGETNKSGVEPAKAVEVVKFVIENCQNLEFSGLMTIGIFDHDLNSGPNPDFQCLLRCRESIVKELKMEVKDIELSMGMTNDYEHAIEVGSTNIRVGTGIFGERDYNK